MKAPSLVVLAAGMGSRYNGLKQIDPVGKNGEIILDFSLYDAYKAGFRKVVFIIQKYLEDEFKKVIGDRVSSFMEIVYVFQDINDIPRGYKLPKGREKPWGTGHAILSCKGVIDEPFAVINSDDYYGRNAFKLMYDYLLENKDDDIFKYAMVGYHLINTVSKNGHVARGICQTNESDNLTEIIERTKIILKDGSCYYTEDEIDWIRLENDSVTSMNFFGFTSSFLKELESQFKIFLDEVLQKDPLKAEFYIPFAVDNLIKSNKAEVKVLKSTDKWYGMTYRKDKPVVVEALTSMQESGFYPEALWSN